ncbi:DUF4956 domain-containing protein [Candidatus Pelagibacter sp.]|nr:DUF4956 domain-containing protein [Candidatus Pelagibacter sp.]
MNNFTIKDLQNFEIDISLDSLLLSLLVATICSLLIKYVYKRFGQSINNKENFSNIFVLLAITTTIVITVVKFSLALSLGLVGALSVVRFRAAIKEPEELVYLFLIIAIGLASGAGQLIPAVILTVFAIIFIYIQSLLRKKQNIYSDVDILNIECPNDLFDEVEKKIFEVFKKENFTLNLKSMTKENNKIFLTFIISNMNSDVNSELIISEIKKININELKINLTKGVPITL